MVRPQSGVRISASWPQRATVVRWSRVPSKMRIKSLERRCATNIALRLFYQRESVRIISCRSWLEQLPVGAGTHSRTKLNIYSLILTCRFRFQVPYRRRTGRLPRGGHAHDQNHSHNTRAHVTDIDEPARFTQTRLHAWARTEGPVRRYYVSALTVLYAQTRFKFQQQLASGQPSLGTYQPKPRRAHANELRSSCARSPSQRPSGTWSIG